MSVLTNIATKLFKEYSLDSKLHKEIAKKLLSEWNIPLGVTNDLLTLRKPAKSESDYVLYHIICELDKTVLPKGYPSAKLAETFNQKYNNEQINLPLTFSMIEVEEGEQWIGRVSARELFRLGNAKLINYNTNTQRVMKRIMAPNGDHFEISLNNKALRDIEKSFDDRVYIPNTITLNIPDIDENVQSYDPNSKILTIKKLKEFDIIDGYHRFVVIQRKCALDESFDHTMELRITRFSEEKARQFIWQEDQKTKMSKVDSESFNKYNMSNVIVKRLQDDMLYGKLISQNKKIIGAAELAQIISTVYNIRTNKEYKPSDIVKISKEILNGFAEFEESYPKIFDNSFSMKEIFVLIAMIRFGVFDYKTYKKICDKAALKNYINKDLKTVESMLKGGKTNV